MFWFLFQMPINWRKNSLHLILEVTLHQKRGSYRKNLVTFSKQNYSYIGSDSLLETGLLHLKITLVSTVLAETCLLRWPSSISTWSSKPHKGHLCRAKAVIPTDPVSLKAIALLPLSHYITTVVASPLTAVNALSFEMNKSQNQEIF